MISEPEPTEVMPTSRPPTAPTSTVGTARMCGSSSLSTLPAVTWRSWRYIRSA